MRRFVILADDEVSREHRDAITLHIDGDADLDWWHWFHRSWLVKDRKDRTPTEWREIIHAVAPQAEIVILEVEPKGSAYWTEKDSADWIAESWPKNN
jgi:hypothetical protein